MHTLSEIEDAIRASWDLDTADEDDGWTPDNPSRGQCDVTSLVLHDIFGGEVLAADVFRNGERVEAHMWNRFPGGVEVDLTRDQFKNGEVIGEPSVRQRPARFDPGTTVIRRTSFSRAASRSACRSPGLKFATQAYTRRSGLRNFWFRPFPRGQRHAG
jgi:hypothetical protein